MFEDQRNIPHVGGRLNRRNELERNVGQADECDDGSGDVVPEFVSREDAANEEVDCVMLVSWGLFFQARRVHCILAALLFRAIPPLPLSDRMLLGTASRTNTTANKAEHEGGISRDLRRDLELCRVAASVKVAIFQAQSQSQRTKQSGSYKITRQHCSSSQFQLIFISYQDQR